MRSRRARRHLYPNHPSCLLAQGADRSCQCRFRNNAIGIRIQADRRAKVWLTARVHAVGEQNLPRQLRSSSNGRHLQPVIARVRWRPVLPKAQGERQARSDRRCNRAKHHTGSGSIQARKGDVRVRIGVGRLIPIDVDVVAQRDVEVDAQAAGLCTGRCHRCRKGLWGSGHFDGRDQVYLIRREVACAGRLGRGIQAYASSVCARELVDALQPRAVVRSHKGTGLCAGRHRQEGLRQQRRIANELRLATGVHARIKHLGIAASISATVAIDIGYADAEILAPSGAVVFED